MELTTELLKCQCWDPIIALAVQNPIFSAMLDWVKPLFYRTIWISAIFPYMDKYCILSGNSWASSFKTIQCSLTGKMTPCSKNDLTWIKDKLPTHSADVPEGRLGFWKSKYSEILNVLQDGPKKQFTQK